MATYSRESQCADKKRLATKAIAKKVARQSQTAFGGGPFVYYRCEWCGAFHTGHAVDGEAERGQKRRELS